MREALKGQLESAKQSGAGRGSPAQRDPVASFYTCASALVAQLAEQRTLNPKVPGSIPGGGIERRPAFAGLFLCPRTRITYRRPRSRGGTGGFPDLFRSASSFATRFSLRSSSRSSSRADRAAWRSGPGRRHSPIHVSAARPRLAVRLVRNIRASIGRCWARRYPRGHMRRKRLFFEAVVRFLAGHRDHTSLKRRNTSGSLSASDVSATWSIPPMGGSARSAGSATDSRQGSAKR